MMLTLSLLIGETGRVVGVAAWPVPLGVEVSEPVAGATVVALIVAALLLIKFYSSSGKFIREQAGVKEAQEMHLTGQPIRVQAEMEFVPMPRFAQLEADVKRREHEILQHVQALELRAEERRLETGGQIDALREQIDDKVGQAIAASNSSAGKIHARIDVLTEKMGDVRGEMKGISEQTGDIRRMLMTTKKA